MCNLFRQEVRASDSISHRTPSNSAIARSATGEPKGSSTYTVLFGIAHATAPVAFYLFHPRVRMLTDSFLVYGRRIYLEAEIQDILEHISTPASQEDILQYYFSRLESSRAQVEVSNTSCHTHFHIFRFSH